MNQFSNSSIRPKTLSEIRNKVSQIKPIIKSAIKPAATAQRTLDGAEANPNTQDRDVLRKATDEVMAALAGRPVFPSRPYIQPAMRAEVQQTGDDAEDIEADEAHTAVESIDSGSEDAPTKPAVHVEQERKEDSSTDAPLTEPKATPRPAMPVRPPVWSRPQIKPIRPASQQPIKQAGQAKQEEANHTDERGMSSAEGLASTQLSEDERPTMAQTSTQNPDKPKITPKHRPGMPPPPLPRLNIKPAIRPATPQPELAPQASEKLDAIQAEGATVLNLETPAIPPSPMVFNVEENDKQSALAESSDHQEEPETDLIQSSLQGGETITVADTPVTDDAFPGTQTSVAKAVEVAFSPYTLGDYQVGEECLIFDDGEDVIRVTATQVYVAFLCGETNGKGCGFCLAWTTRSGKQCNKVIPMTRVVADWSSLLGELGDEGLFVLSPRHFKGYLLEACSRAELPEVRLITQIGFLPLNPEVPLGAYGFMMPSGAILPVDSQLGQVNAKSLRYRPPFEHPALGAYAASGTHAQWKEGIAPAEGNVLAVFCTCAVLASVMLQVSGGENCGFHMHGLSSSGKSTAGQVGMSVLACAADPQSSHKPTTFGSWSATDNGRELLAACASGSAMFLDELDSTPKGMSITIYPLLNGSGKVRMRSAGGMSTQYFWRLLALSTGEVSLYERMMREPQREVMLGELSRFLDIPVDNLPRDSSLSVEQAQSLAQALKQRSGEVYGTACTALVQNLFATYATLGELSAALLEVIEIAHVELCSHLAARRPLRAAHKRAVRHFALVLAVGRWAADGVLPFSVAAIERAVFSVAEAWFDNFPSLNEEDRLQDSVRAYLREQRENVVSTASSSESAQHGRVPKILLHDGRLYMAPDSFHQACGDLPVVKAGKLLERVGVLHRHGGEGQKVKMTVWPSLFRSLRYYALDAARLLGARELADLVSGVQNSAAAQDDYDADGLPPAPVL